jgi:hypothetical protein
MNFRVKARLAAALLGCGFGVTSFPANACIEVVQGGCAIQAQIDQQVRDHNNYRAYLEATQGSVTYGSPAPAIPNRPPPPPPSSYISVYWHPDASDVWAVWNHENFYYAGLYAYSACVRVMGDGCALMVEGKLSTVAIARDQYGGILFGKDRDPAKASALLRNYCVEQKRTCQPLHEFTAKMPKKGMPFAEAYFAGGSAIYPERRRFAVGLTNRFGSHDELWVAAGVPSEKGARAVAKQLCEQTNNQRKAGSCFENEKPQFVAESAYVLIFRDTAGTGDAVSGANKQDLVQQATALCIKRGKARCAAGAFLDARVNRTALINFSKLPAWPRGGVPVDMPAPIFPNNGGPTGTGPGSGLSYRSQTNPNAGGTFTAQAWINSEKHNAHIWQYMVWSVSGGRDGPSTSEAALQACQTESGFECELVNSTQNAKIVLYTDEKHAMRVSQTRREVDPAPLILARCRDQKSDCRVVKVIDSHAPLIERIEVR